MSFISLLRQEHREARETLQRLLSLTKVNHAEATSLCYKLLLHMELEETLFYPALQQFKEAKMLLGDINEEHAKAKTFIDALLVDRLTDGESKEKLEKLQLCIEQHITEEEKELFPLALKKLTRVQLHSITAEMKAMKVEQAKWALAPH